MHAPGQRFCGACGASLTAAVPPSAAAPAASPASPPLFGTSPWAGEPVLPTEAPALEGRETTRAAIGAVAERRLVSVLFADLVGFTPFAEERDAEDVRETLTHYFDLASDVIVSHGGTVEKFIGDAVMAVWGTPVAREDDAERAVRAALELLVAVRALGGQIQARAAVLTGEAAVTIGATNQGMVAGDLVNTAARLQGVAAPTTVLVGELTQRLTSGAIMYEQAGEHALKGKLAPVPAWRAVRVVADRAGRRRTDTLEAPFIGRDDDLRLIKDLYHATVREGRIRLVSVTGVGGSGKSRIAWEFEKYIDGIVGTVYWHHGRSPAYGEGVTFWALGEMIRQRARLAETDDEQTTRRKVADLVASVARDDRERAWIHSAFLALLGVEQGKPEELFGAWRTFFERVAETGPVVLLFEDLHWADSGTLDFIEHLLEWSRNAPIYIVTLARPELLDRRPTWGAGRRSFTSLSLDPLPEGSMRDILSGLVRGLPEQAVQEIVERAEGVPLYAIETVRMLVDDGRLTASDDGIYRLTGDLTEIAVPPTLTALIAARLDALPPSDRVLVLDAAVLGQSFTTAGLAAVSGVDEATVAARLQALVRSEMVDRVADPLSPERGQFAFVQALVREVAYNTLAKKDRKTRHLAAARFFESLGTDEVAGALAGHYLAAHRLATEGPEQEALAKQARLALRGAAERASSLGAHDQALAFLNEAMTVVTEPAEAAELVERAGEVATIGARADEAETYLREALRLQRELGNAPGIARAGAKLGRALTVVYHIEPALKLLTEVAEEIKALRDTPDGLEVDIMLARANWLRDEPLLTLQLVDRVLGLAERMDLVEIVAEGMILRGGALGDLGRTYEGLPIMEAGVRLAERHGFTAVALRGVNSLSGYLNARDPRASVALLEEGIANARRIGHRASMIRMLTNAASAWLETGELARASTEMEGLLATPLGREDRLFTLANQANTFILVGRDYAPLVAELEALLEGEADPNVANNLFGIRALVALVEGRFGEAFTAALEAARLSPFNAPGAISTAGHAGTWQGDPELVRRALATHEATATHGGVIDLRRAAMRATLAGLDGRLDEATNGLRVAIAGLRSTGAATEEILTGIDAVAVLGAQVDPTMVSATRDRIIELGAHGLLPILERLRASPPGAARVASHASQRAASVEARPSA
jgi:class 3 adenylate cyclase/tetratricopeptide (TPR) repeat protein